MDICVYLSAQDGKSEAYKETVRRFGRFIAENGHRLIYGGSKSGLMGEIAISALEAGGEVIGVEPEFFIEAEFQLEGLTELIVTRSMNERKEKLIELSDVFVAFPGSTGTLEEIADTVSMIKMGMIAKKIIIFNYNGFYEPLKILFASMISEELIREDELSGVLFADSEAELMSLIEKL